MPEIEKFFAYTLDVTLSNVPALSLSLALQGDADFIWTGLLCGEGFLERSADRFPVNPDYQAIDVAFRLRDPNGNYIQRRNINDLHIPQPQLVPTGGGVPWVIYPPFRYARDGRFEGDFIPPTGAAPNGKFNLTFLGTKRFDLEDQRFLIYRGPEKYVPDHWQFPGPVHIILKETGTSPFAPALLSNTIFIDEDADFALHEIRYTNVRDAAGNGPPDNAGLRFRWYDSYGQAMQNNWLPVAAVIGNTDFPRPIHPPVIFPAGSRFLYDLWRPIQTPGEPTDFIFQISLVGEKRRKVL